jgi:hypothetical protein
MLLGLSPVTAAWFPDKGEEEEAWKVEEEEEEREFLMD